MTVAQPFKVRIALGYTINLLFLAWMPQMAAASSREPFDKQFMGASAAVIALVILVPLLFRPTWKIRIAALVAMILPVLLLTHTLIVRARL